MKELLDPIVMIPGVRYAAMISPDGVPILACEGKAVRAGSQTEGTHPFNDFSSFAAQAAGWLGDAVRTVAPLTWEAPRRVVLSATRGDMVMCQGPNAVLVVMLEHGVSAQELRIPMDSSLARMQRALQRMGDSNSPASQPDAPQRPQGIHPSTGGTPSASVAPETAPASRVTEKNG
ncbi:MAG: putative regulator of Ras-like GTPase activity (Roadblock/LC7/MglB family) [Planctomycetota bacterium]|jgi:predicted regulator of Ras-like GTPase activity (Roadblock/LC7/MglB family)